MKYSALTYYITVGLVSQMVLLGKAAAAEPSASSDESNQQVVTIREAPDGLSGRFDLSPRLSYLFPLGSLDSGLSQGDVLDGGPVVGADLSYGVSRYLSLRLSGDYASLSGDDRLGYGRVEGAFSWSVRTGIEYHLVDGAGVDPWVAACTGVRFTNLDYRSSDATVATRLRYSGIEWLNVSLGTSWYVSESLGVGPYVFGSWGKYSRRPERTMDRPGSFEDQNASYFMVGTGLRFTLSLGR